MDALLVLGGEGSDGSRSYRAVAQWHKSAAQGKELPVILSGKQSGILAVDLPTPECDTMRERMASCGIPQTHLLTERESLDTIANFIYSRQIIDSIGARRIGIVTDRFHMPRAQALGRHVLGTAYELVTVPSFIGTGIAGRLRERALTAAILHDTREIASGDDNAFRDYLTTRHPFHAPRNGNIAPLSAYGLLIGAQRMMG